MATRFVEAQEKNSKLTLLMMDVDDFKKVNDTYGHPVGDIVLRSLGSCIRGTSRDSDQPFRYGGEEFAVLMPDTSTETAVVLAERIRRQISEIVFKSQPDLHVTVNIGIATYPDDVDGLDALVEAADKALYRAKAAGKNAVVTVGEGARRAATT